MKSGPKGSRFYDNHIYAAYRGDTYIMDGTLDEIAKATGRKRKNLQRLLVPSVKLIQEKPRMDGKPKACFTLTLLDEGSDDE